MRKRVWIVMVLMALLLLAGSVPAWADPPGKLTGSINFEPPDWWDYYRVWLNFDVHQVDPSTGEAEGMIKARVYNPTLGTKRLWYEAKCVSFGQVEGHPSAIVVAQIVRREGWDDVPGAGDPGEYLRWQVIDVGTPGASGDEWQIQWYDYANWVEYWPAYPDGGCSDFQVDSKSFADHGNLVIHP